MSQKKTNEVKELRLIAVQITYGVIGQNWITNTVKTVDYQNC